MVPLRESAEQALYEAETLNPGNWIDHSRYVALACCHIAGQCPGLDQEKAYVLGLLHDIGRRIGVVSEKHMIAGYRYCMKQGWEEVAPICVTHSFMIQDIETAIGKWDVTDEEYAQTKQIVIESIYSDYDRLVQLCDALAQPSGFCLLEKRMVDIACRYGISDNLTKRWKKLFEIKDYFDRKIGGSLYKLLPGIVENTFK